jgi:hypothetical protein
MTGVEHYTTDFSLTVTPSVGVTAVQPQQALFNLTVTPSVGMTAVLRTGFPYTFPFTLS